MQSIKEIANFRTDGSLSASIYFSRCQISWGGFRIPSNRCWSAD